MHVHVVVGRCNFDFVLTNLSSVRYFSFGLASSAVEEDCSATSESMIYEMSKFYISDVSLQLTLGIGINPSNRVAEVTAVAPNRAERQQWAALAYCFENVTGWTMLKQPIYSLAHPYLTWSCIL